MRAILAIALAACTTSAPTEPRTAAPRDAAVADRCLPVLVCGDCPGPCTAGAHVTAFASAPVSIRTLCVAGTCTDVFDPHRPCKDSCAPPTTIDTTCRFDAHGVCSSGASSPTPDSVGCRVLPQPSKPGRTSVEPDDMACTHGDILYDCPADFDRQAARFRCARTTHPGWWSPTRTWCCPGA